MQRTPRPAIATRRAIAIAVAWAVVVLVLSSFAICYEEARILTTAAWDRVRWLTNASFVAVPPLAGMVHRSVRIALLAVASSAVAWMISRCVATYAYNTIGGGP